ncbi:ECF-type sigma factor [Paenibacillus sp. GCM10012307]|uniref:Sigma-70 family RNA polymerase sigma factor n=1 Tax=Paenibacillus roseus TaxID=2798579 RepID=A0A934IW67_9BACL|nr:ECF-type sigma factor [Paenibacillus roseus]MBJ6360421.1 sigma-70 family RNA polymerase sigma factor [Paenibacillus roseus]
MADKPYFEEQVVNQLKGYKRLASRIAMLEKQPVGMGISVSRGPENDRLQALHRKLKDMPSYMYLSQKEQDLELTAHAYLENYTTGTLSQLREVRRASGVDEEDQGKLNDIARRVAKVLEARRGDGDSYEGYEGALRRLDEIKELQEQKERIDGALELLATYKPDYTKLLKLRFIEGMSVEEVSAQLLIVRKTFSRWKPKAIEEYAELAGLSR